MAKKYKLPSQYRETPEQRRERVNAEGGRYRSRIETPKTTYNRKRLKHDDYHASMKGGN